MRPTRRRALIASMLLVALGACGDDADELGDLPPAVDEADEGEPEEEVEPTPTPEPTPTGQVYEVQPGDTLWGIAEEFGTTVDALVEANDIDDPEQIFPGDELVIPGDG